MTLVCKAYLDFVILLMAGMLTHSRAGFHDVLQGNSIMTWDGSS